MIDGDEAQSPIIAEGHTGKSMAPACGISIYFPLFLDRAAFYRDLDFASATHWADLLDACAGNARMDLTRFRGHCRSHESAVGVFHGQAQAASVHGGVQG
jgi:hypothetical protein